MELSWRDLIAIVHGMGFGTLFMIAFSGAIGVIQATAGSGGAWPAGLGLNRLFRLYLVGMAALAWLAVLSGTYLIYPWYRATPPAGATDLTLYPRAFLLSSPHTAGWHGLGMEWKEHVAWFAPIAMTMVAAVFIQYGPTLGRLRGVRSAVLVFTAAAFFATAVAGGFGAMLTKVAPVHGGETIVILRGEAP